MPKRILQGTVTSDANAQTVTVSVERRFKHPVLQTRHDRRQRSQHLGETHRAHGLWLITSIG